MNMSLDPEIAVALAAQARAAAEAGVGMPAPGDALGLRVLVDSMMSHSFQALPDAPAVTTRTVTAASSDGADVELRWYLPETTGTGAAIVYIHGGGMICGSVDIYDPLMRYYVQRTGVPFLAVDYRIAPEHTGSVAVEDCVAALAWLLEHATDWGIDSQRVALMGDSAGGGIAAGTAILARKRGISLAKQILVYPMLDDRTTTPDPLLASTATWTYENNYTGWSALLGDQIGSTTVSPAVAPARLTDFQGLAPAYIEVGELDIFRDESIAYATSLMTAGVPCELHVYPRAPHGYDLLNLEAQLSRRALDHRVRIVAGL
ncbi:alpha/beta hydrolase [Rhodococcus aetherivorans]